MELNELLKYVEYVKYKIESLSIVLKSETLNIQPAFVSEVLLEYDYDQLCTPILILSVALTQVEYRKIVQEKDTVKFIVKLNKMYYNDAREFLYYKTFFNQTFCTHILDENPIMEQDILNKTKAANNTDDTSRNPMDMRDIYDFALFIEEHIDAGNKEINMAIESGKMNDILAYVLNFAGFNKNVLMSPSNNTSKITNLLCPIMNTVKTINYLQEIKGIYNSGLLFFMDFNTIYLIDKSAYCSAWRPKEYTVTNIYIFSQKSEYNVVVGQMIDNDEEKNNLFTNTDSTDIQNKSVLNNVVYGNKMVLINAKTGTVNYIDENLKQRGDSHAHIELQKHDNKYARNSRTLRLIENEYDVNIIMKDIDLELLSPNKCFKLIFQDTKLNEKYGGTYRIAKTLSTLTKLGEELDSTVICNFKKQNNNVNEFGDEYRFDDWNEYESADSTTTIEKYTKLNKLSNSTLNEE